MRGMRNEPLPTETERVCSAVLDAAFVVHSALGPGLLENIYEVCLVHELQKRGLKVERQVAFPVWYDELVMDAAFRIDILVERCLIIELKAVEAILPIHKAQTLTYLKLTNIRLGLLLNFNVPLLRDGINRIVL